MGNTVHVFIYFLWIAEERDEEQVYKTGTTSCSMHDGLGQRTIKHEIFVQQQDIVCIVKTLKSSSYLCFIAVRANKTFRPAFLFYSLRLRHLDTSQLCNLMKQFIGDMMHSDILLTWISQTETTSLNIFDLEHCLQNNDIDRFPCSCRLQDASSEEVLKSVKQLTLTMLASANVTYFTCTATNMP